MINANTAYSMSAGNHLAYKSTRSERDREYDALARVTRNLSAGMTRTKSHDFPTYVSALTKNRELWMIFSSDVRSENNQLPKEIKSGILNISNFVQRFTSRALNQHTDITPLIEINLFILKGLGDRGSCK